MTLGYQAIVIIGPYPEYSPCDFPSLLFLQRCWQGPPRFVIRDSDTDEQGDGRWGEDWPIGQLLDLEASNLDQREDEQERWRWGEKARGRQTAERGGGAKEISAVRWRLCCSLSQMHRLRQRESQG